MPIVWCRRKDITVFGVLSVKGSSEYGGRESRLKTGQKPARPSTACNDTISATGAQHLTVENVARRIRNLSLSPTNK